MAGEIAPRRLTVNVHTDELELVGMVPGSDAELLHLPPDRRLVHAVALEALEATAKVPHHPEPHQILGHPPSNQTRHWIDQGLSHALYRRRVCVFSLVIASSYQ